MNTTPGAGSVKLVSSKLNSVETCQLSGHI